MDEKIDAAMEKVLGLIRSNMKEDEVQKVTQAALNMAHVKQNWASLNLAPKRKTSET
jgi:hypothetical protein